MKVQGLVFRRRDGIAGVNRVASHRQFHVLSVQARYVIFTEEGLL